MMEDTFGFLDLSQTFVEIWSRKRKSSILSSNSRIQDLCNVKKKQLTTLLKTEKAFPFVPLAFSILVPGLNVEGSGKIAESVKIILKNQTQSSRMSFLW